MKRNTITLTILLFILSTVCHAQTSWTNLSGGLDDLDIKALTADPLNANHYYAASGNRLYKTVDRGASWKRVLSLRGSDNEIHVIYVDPDDSQTVYIGTRKGLQVSKDGGKKAKVLFKPIGADAEILSLMKSGPDRLWIGTKAGLFSFELKNSNYTKIKNLPKNAIRSIYFHEATRSILVTAEDGIYKTSDDGRNWQRVFFNEHSSPDAEETSLEQFDIEQLTMPFFSNIAFSHAEGKFYAATREGLLTATQNADVWQRPEGQSFKDAKINFIVASAVTFYAATDKGIYQWDPKAKTFKELYKGLESDKVNALAYSAQNDCLLAGTKKGIFQLAHPDLNLVAEEKKIAKPHDVLKNFQAEPTIHEIQKAAIHYAEVYPEKIQAWRSAAAKKAFLPTLSVGGDATRDQNVDLDRGGTGDPDKFIMGPEEKSFDWSVGVSWDLGDLIWNDDQTSIDTRSRLLVELRDDILNEVTHLYFERRRLQVEMALSPPQELPIQIEKELRLQELTAGIDGLTGGYLSKRISHVEDSISK